MRPFLEQLEPRCLPDAAAAAYFEAHLPAIEAQVYQDVVHLQSAALPAVTAAYGAAVTLSRGLPLPALAQAASNLQLVQSLPALYLAMQPTIAAQIAAEFLSAPPLGF